ncbi:MAG: enoyl-CoA hydratase/isomerase family protein [Nitriliruptorales bacterium]
MAVDFRTEGAVGTITLDDPPANSYDRAFMDELAGAVDAAATSDGVNVVVVESASEKFFCAGADVKAFRANSVDDNMEMIRLAHGTLARIAEIPKVFVAQIAGHALGGGLEIALACDLRFGADAGYLVGLPEVTLGLLPGNGGTQRLPRLVGVSTALRLMLTGERLEPDAALELGILDRVFPAGELEKETRAYAEQLASGATRAIGNIKLAVHRGVDGPLDEGLALERDLLEELFRSADAAEGLAAFAEKRAPEFKGT